MRCLVLADIHSNLEAMQAVMRHAESLGGFESIWCLGDTVGYGADPGACIDMLRSYPHMAVSGNHDLAAADAVSLDDFNPHARAAALWTRDQLSSEHREYLKGNPLRLEAGEVTLLHGTPRDPVWEYFLPSVLPANHVAESFGLFSSRCCLVGHSHIPLVCMEEGAQFFGLQERQRVPLAEARFVMNPGSVGQPRDGDPRAAYALYDSDAAVLVHHRVPYDVETAQAKIVQAGLPEALAARLAVGR